MKKIESLIVVFFVEFQKIFARRENRVAAMMMLGIGIMFFAPVAVMAADPMAVMKNIYLNQAQTNAFPVIILWILALGAVMSFKMNAWTPFILAIAASVIIGIAPDLVPNFTFADLNSTTP